MSRQGAGVVSVTNEWLIARLQEIGPLPDDRSPAIQNYPLQAFDDYLQQLTVPLHAEQASALLDLGPPPDASAYEVEWALVHVIETISAAELERILPMAADTEVTRLVALRLANYYKAKK